MTKGQICFSQEYCTDCPERKSCTVRPTFYSEEKYQCWRNETLDQTARIAKVFSFPTQSIPLGMDIGVKMMDKRRAKELELHPTYSPE